LDEPYFLYETLQTLERYRDSFTEHDVTLLVSENSLNRIQQGYTPLFPKISTSIKSALEEKYDLSINLSLNEVSWSLHEKVTAAKKIGAFYLNYELCVPDVWSAYYMTLKDKAPFLTFHLQDIFKNILGLKQIDFTPAKKKKIKTIAFGFCHPELFSATELEQFISDINEHFPNLELIHLSELDTVADLSHVLYLGPATIEALRTCEFGARGVFLSRSFQGFNLLPAGDGHLFLSTRGKSIKSPELSRFISNFLLEADFPDNFPYAVYQLDQENLFGTYLKSLNQSDEHYPVYQAHVVLWNFLLNLFDTNLEIVNCTAEQKKLLHSHMGILEQVIRIYDYAMRAIDQVHQQSKGNDIEHVKLEQSLKQLKEIELLTEQVSQSHSFIRPLLDFYRIRRGQNRGDDLLSQSQHSFLVYSEEQQALKALRELFSVTLQKNTASI
jgi:hypothetical protein